MLRGLVAGLAAVGLAAVGLMGPVDAAQARTHAKAHAGKTKGHGAKAHAAKHKPRHAEAKTPGKRKGGRHALAQRKVAAHGAGKRHGHKLAVKPGKAGAHATKRMRGGHYAVAKAPRSVGTAHVARHSHRVGPMRATYVPPPVTEAPTNRSGFNAAFKDIRPAGSR